MTGTSEDEFSPNVAMSRAMMVTVLYRLEDEPEVTGDIPFTDVKDDEWYTDAILWASQNNIVYGYGNGTFGLNDLITREQLVTILNRYAQSKEMDVSASVDLTEYSDLKDISDWALTAMKWAVAAGIIKGRAESAIAPRGTATRAEAATIFMRYVGIFPDAAGDSNN